MSRSFTHPISNTVVLDNLNLRNGFGQALKGKLPKNNTPSFLHEITHHWCFNSPVGIALSILAINARINVLSSLEHDPLKESEIISDELRYNVSMSMLSPILEGMSLFAEHDLWMGDSEVMSPISTITSIMFFGKEEWDSKFLEHVSYSLVKERVSKKFFDRKLDLFCDSLDCDESPYLVGYLSTKSLFFEGRRKCEKFSDRDLFLNYLKSYFFDDWCLVDLLLSSENEPTFIPEDIVTYVENRIRDFFTLDHNAAVSKFESDILQKNHTTFEIENEWVISQIKSTSVLSKAPDSDLKERFGTKMQDLLTKSSQYPELLFIVKSLVVNRNLMTLGNNKFQAEVNKHGRMTIKDQEGEVVLILPAGSEHGKDIFWKSEIDMDLIFKSEPMGLHAILSDEQGSFFAFSLGQNELTDDEVKLYVNRSLTLDIITILNKATVRFEKLENYGLFERFSKEVLRNRMNNFYVPVALIYTPDELILSAAKNMFVNGLMSIFGDEDMLEKCVSASIFSSGQLNPYYEDYKDHWIDGNPTQTVETLNIMINDKLGFHNFRISNELELIFSQLI